MRWLFALLLLSALSVPQASAIVDPDPDGIGIYFDLNADVNEIAMGASVPFIAYTILTNPTGAEIQGYEFSRIISVPPGMEGMVFQLDEFFWPPWIVFIFPPVEGINVIVGLSEPYPSSPAMVLVESHYMILSPAVVMDFFLGPTTGEGSTNGQLAYMTTGGWVPMHVSSGDPALPVAKVNGTGVIPVVESTFGSVKALYR